MSVHEDIDSLFGRIALEHLFIETLQERKMDDLDFHDVHVLCLRDALMAAFEAGRDSVDHA